MMTAMARMLHPAAVTVTAVARDRGDHADFGELPGRPEIQDRQDYAEIPDRQEAQELPETRELRA